MENKPSQQNIKPASCTFPNCSCARTIEGCYCNKSIEPFNAYYNLSHDTLASQQQPAEGEIIEQRIEANNKFWQEMQDRVEAYNKSLRKPTEPPPTTISPAEEELEIAINLITVQKDYIDFLGKAYSRAFSNAYIHHYRESKEDIEKGKEMRMKITDIEKHLAAAKRYTRQGGEDWEALYISEHLNLLAAKGRIAELEKQLQGGEKGKEEELIKKILGNARSPQPLMYMRDNIIRYCEEYLNTMV